MDEEKYKGRNSRLKYEKNSIRDRRNTSNRENKLSIIERSRELANQGKVLYSEVINKLQVYGKMTPQELTDDMARPDVTNLELVFGGVMAEAVAGDRYARDFVIDRLWGKAPDIAPTGLDSQTDMLRKIPMNELIALYKKYNQPDVIDVSQSKERI